MIQNIFKNKKVFKLILGAGNEDIETIKKLVFIYSKAGANIFDVRADRKIISEVIKILELTGKTDSYICASIALGDDIHFKKAQITDKCNICKKCIPHCPSGAIYYLADKIKIFKDKCIGCQNCSKYCKNKAISFYSHYIDYKQTFSEISDLPIDYIEVHSDGSDDEVYECFKFLKENFAGLKGICLSASKISDKEKIETVKKIKDIIHPEKLVVQADGSAMSGFDNSKNTTLKALEASRLFIDNIDDIFVIPSGGTNANTANLAKEQGININGVAIGTYARKIVSDYLHSDEQKAIKIASNLVNSV